MLTLLNNKGLLPMASQEQDKFLALFVCACWDSEEKKLLEAMENKHYSTIRTFSNAFYNDETGHHRAQVGQSVRPQCRSLHSFLLLQFAACVVDSLPHAVIPQGWQSCLSVSLIQSNSCLVFCGPCQTCHLSHDAFCQISNSRFINADPVCNSRP